MTEPMKLRWDDVGQRFEALGRVVKERYQSEPSSGAEDMDASEERAALREAFEKVVAAARELVDRSASVVRDPAVKEQTSLVARSLNDALTASVDQIGEEVGRFLKRTKGVDSSESDNEPEAPEGGEPPAE